MISTWWLVSLHKFLANVYIESICACVSNLLKKKLKCGEQLVKKEWEREKYVTWSFLKFFSCTLQTHAVVIIVVVVSHRIYVMLKMLVDVRKWDEEKKKITRFWLFAIFLYISSIILDRVLIILVIYASVSIKSVSEWENNLSENNLHNNNRSCYFENLIRWVCRMCVYHSLEMMWLQF